MRIAIYDPAPRVCGPSAWCWHLKAGVEALGHEADVVSSTASGKPRARWQRAEVTFHGVRDGCDFARMPDVVVRHDELPDVLNGYHRVVLAELRCPPQDKNVVGRGVPLYVAVMRKCRRRWTSYLHGPMDVELPYLAELLDAGRFTGKLLSLHEDLYDLPRYGGLFGGVERRTVPLPFVRRRRVGSIPEARTIGMLGRLTGVKGQQAMFAMAAFMPRGTRVEAWGACAIGKGPRESWLLAMMLRYLGWDVEVQLSKEYCAKFMPSFVTSGDWQYVDMEAILKHVTRRPAQRPYLWRARRSGVEAAYRGAYPLGDPRAALSEMGVGVSITASSFARWVEFTCLEYVDAGLLIVGARHLMTSSRLAYIPVDAERFPVVRREDHAMAERPLTKGYVAELRSLKTAMLAAVEQVGSSTHREMAEHNWDVLRKDHSPARFAERMLECLS
jgi:hypothetical protein